MGGARHLESPAGSRPIPGFAAKSIPRLSSSWRPLSWCARPVPAVAVSLIWAGTSRARYLASQAALVDGQPVPGGDQLFHGGADVGVFRLSQTTTSGPPSCWCAASSRLA